MHEKRKYVIKINNVNPISAYKCEQAVCLLRKRIASIPSVQFWAEEAGVSRRWLCKIMKMTYGKPPKLILREMRYEKVVLLIQKYSVEASCYSVAIDAGFNDGKTLSRFLSSYYQTTFTRLKEEIVLKNVRVSRVLFSNVHK